MIELLHNKAKELLENKTADVIIGYGQGSSERRTTPIFITSPEDVQQLIWNDACLNNLTVFLHRKDVKKLGKPAIVAKGCDVKAIIGLIQENQLKRDDVVIIGMACQDQKSNSGPDRNVLEKCLACRVRTPKEYDILIEDPNLIEKESQKPSFEDVEALDAKSPQERWDYWQAKLENCIKCYACRQACPLCYCNRCIVEKTQPQWIHPSANQKGNLAWNVIRAFHLAGRCTGCGECERVCPMNIPLSIVNKKMAKEVHAAFDYVAGEDMETKPPLSDFRYEDDDTFIR